MRANQFLLFLTAVLCLCTGTAVAQQGSDSIVVAIEDGNGILLPDSVLLYEIGGSSEVAPTTGDGFYFVLADNQKARLVVEHPNFGSASVDVQLPGTGEGTILLSMSDDGMQAKTVPWDRIVYGRQGITPNPITPPPGQGCQLPNQVDAFGTDLTNPPFLRADCVEIANDGDLTHLVFWGGYLNICVGGDCGPGPGDDFTVNYYEATADGCTGNLLLSVPNIGLTQKFSTGNLIAGFVQEYQYQTEFHAPLAVTAGQRITIEIFNNTTGDSCCAWYWEVSSDGDGLGCNSQVPAPGGLDQAVCVNLQINGGGCPPPAPDNDECADCESISGEGDFAFDNGGATSNGPDHVICDSFGTQAIDNDVWFCWTAPCDADVRLQTCALTAVDTKIAVYDSGWDCGDLDASILVCNDDACGLQSSADFTAVGGNTYLFRIGTFPGASGGPGLFNVTCTAGPPANDDCGAAEALAIGATVSGDTSFATADANAFDCVTSVTAPGVWYSIVGDGNTLTLSTCDQASYDTKIHVYCGTCGALICVTGNDDGAGCGGFTSLASFCSAAGQDYLVLVSGFSTLTGAFDLTLSTDSVPCGSPPACSVPVTTNVDIRSNLNGVFVDVDPIDLHGQTAGLTPFTRLYNPLTFVEINAPTQWDSSVLLGALVNDRVLRPGNGRYAGILNEYKKVKLVYGDSDTRQDGDVLHH